MMSKVKCECERFVRQYPHDVSLLEIAKRHAIATTIAKDFPTEHMPEDLEVTITYEGNPDPQTVVVRVELTARVLNPRGE